MHNVDKIKSFFNVEAGGTGGYNCALRILVTNDKIYRKILLKHFQVTDRAILVSEDSKFKLL
jgi:hypothetical protein